MDFVEHVEQISFGVDSDSLDARHDFADYLLLGCGAGPILEAT
jgi:hypothetical protein